MIAKRGWLGCLIVLAVSAADARAQNDDACRVALTNVLEELGEGLNVTRAYCTALAGVIIAELTSAEADTILASRAFPDVFSIRDLQNRSSQHADLAGTPAQGHAIPSVQPAGVAAGTIAAVGTEAGEEALAALSINPAVLFLADRASERLARLSRLADVTVFVPVSGVTGGDASVGDGEKLRYLGARVRVNITGLSAGSDVWDTARQLLRDRISANALAHSEIESILTGASDVRACADALLGVGDAPEAVTEACGVPFGFLPDLDAAARLRRELAGIRRAADANYFGADFRIDYGDPALGAVEDARGRFLFTGLAAGRRLADREMFSLRARARVGLRYTTLDAADETDFGVEGGVGLEASRAVADDELTMSGAIVFRYGSAPDDLTEQFQTDFTMFRGSIVLPVAAGNSIGLNIGVPLRGEVSPVLSVNFNWGLLLSDQVGAG